MKSKTPKSASREWMCPRPKKHGYGLCNCMAMIHEPIRLTEFIIMVVLFSEAVYLTAQDQSPLTIVASVCLILLIAIYILIIGIQVIGYIGGSLRNAGAMLVFAVLGVVLFTLAAQLVYLQLYLGSSHAGLLLLVILCQVAGLLFLLEIILLMTHWRRNAMKKRECAFRLSDECLSSHRSINDIRAAKCGLGTDVRLCDAVTSVSHCDPIEFEETGGFCNFDRIGRGPRRSYVDDLTETVCFDFAKETEVQTQEIAQIETKDDETLTSMDVKEEPAQTSTNCPVCLNQCDNNMPDTICPTFLALIQTMNMLSCRSSLPLPNIPACNANKETLATEVAAACVTEVEDSGITIGKRPPRVYETRPCPTHGAGLKNRNSGIPNVVTRVTIPRMIRKNKRTQTPTKVQSDTTEESRESGNDPVDERQFHYAPIVGGREMSDNSQNFPNDHETVDEEYSNSRKSSDNASQNKHGDARETNKSRSLASSSGAMEKNKAQSGATERNESQSSAPDSMERSKSQSSAPDSMERNKSRSSAPDSDPMERNRSQNSDVSRRNKSQASAVVSAVSERNESQPSAAVDETDEQPNESVKSQAELVASSAEYHDDSTDPTRSNSTVSETRKGSSSTRSDSELISAPEARNDDSSATRRRIRSETSHSGSKTSSAELSNDELRTAHRSLEPRTELLPIIFQDESLNATDQRKRLDNSLLSIRSPISKSNSERSSRSKAPSERSLSQKSTFRKSNKVDPNAREESINKTENTEFGTTKNDEPPQTKDPNNTCVCHPNRLTVKDVTSSCMCHFYKDLFGRNMCEECAKNHIIKIPQRQICRPNQNLKCWKCSETIRPQITDDEKVNCGKCGRPRTCKMQRK